MDLAYFWLLKEKNTKSDYDFISQATNLYIEITRVIPYRPATFDSPAEGGDVYFRAYDELGKDVTDTLNYLQENSIEQEAIKYLAKENEVY